MEKKIYTSSFRTGENATKKQQMLFATDTAYALSEGYSFIKDCDGDTFKIVDAHNLIQVGDDLEEDCSDCDCCKEPTVADFDPTHSNMGATRTSEKTVSNRKNYETIDLVIHNTLNQKTTLRADQIDSMLKLGQLKAILGTML